jgi:hypothetical protein
MIRLLLVLALLLFPEAYGQENPYAGATQTGNLVPDFSFENGQVGTIPQGWTSTSPPATGGSIQPGCGGLSNQGQCFKFSYQGAILQTDIDLSIYNTNSFEFYFDFFYRMNCNNSIGGFCEDPDGPMDLFGASVKFFTASGEAGVFDFIPIGPDYFVAGDPGVNNLGYKPVGWYSSQVSDELFTNAVISFYGIDTGFWGGYYGPSIDRVNFRIGYLEAPDPVIGVDCTLNPYDPSCIINTLDLYDDGIIDYSDPEEVAEMLADETAIDDDNTGSDDGSDDGTEVIADEEEEVFVADETIDETELEQLLQDEETTVEETPAETNEREVTYRELTDEEKAQILADSISKNTLELALSVAEAAASNNMATTETLSTTTARTNISTVDDEVETKEQDKIDNDETVADNSIDSANDLLETGRQLNNVSMAQTQAQTEQSASDSISQAESIAMISGETKSNDSIIENITIDNVIDNSVADNDGSDFEIMTEENKVETVVEEVVANNIEQSVDGSVDTIDSFTDIMNIDIKPTDTSTDDVEFVQNVLAQIEQKSEDTSVSAFEEDEKVTIQNDPNLANAFNVVPNTTNLEILGVLGNNKDEKSDAEKRAEEVVAANKEQQDEINKNYMDADQSGIVAAMSGDTDVSSYRSAMLNDNNIWYKPEDIYKNVVYKDNVRGAYFLEKGNSDTYKKMVEEQYK